MGGVKGRIQKKMKFGVKINDPNFAIVFYGELALLVLK
jgi:hypothetical protein